MKESLKRISPLLKTLFLQKKTKNKKTTLVNLNTQQGYLEDWLNKGYYILWQNLCNTVEHKILNSLGSKSCFCHLLGYISGQTFNHPVPVSPFVKWGYHLPHKVVRIKLVNTRKVLRTVSAHNSYLLNPLIIKLPLEKHYKNILNNVTKLSKCTKYKTVCKTGYQFH